MSEQNPNPREPDTDGDKKEGGWVGRGDKPFLKRHDRPSPRAQTRQHLFTTDLLELWLSAKQSRKPRAEDGDQIGDVGGVRVVRARVAGGAGGGDGGGGREGGGRDGGETLVPLGPLPRRRKVRLLRVSSSCSSAAGAAAAAVAELHLPLLGRGLRALAAALAAAAAVLVQVAVLYRGHHMRVQVQHCGLVAVRAAAAAAATGGEQQLAVRHCRRLHAAASVIVRLFGRVLLFLLLQGAFSPAVRRQTCPLLLVLQHFL